MKPFESFMAQSLEEFIDYRSTLGYTDNNLRSLLRPFDRYAKDKTANWDFFQPLFLLGFREHLKGDPRRVNRILCTVRGFFQFLVRKGSVKENPMQHVPPLAERAFIPFVFSPEQVQRLLNAVQKRLRKSEKNFLKDLGIYMVLMLMTRCGLRISEPLRLLYANYRPKEGTIYIEKTKFNKDRLIPLPKRVTTEITNYLAARNAWLHGDKNPFLFAGHANKALSDQQVYSVFHHAVKDIGLNQPRRIIADTTFGAPRPHSLRHSFAINTLKDIKQRGKSPQDALPVLAAYMGHTKYRYTAVYLKVIDAEQRHGLVDFSISRQEEI
jgi:integrase/recombinase XerD